MRARRISAGPLRERDFRLLFIGQATSSLGNSLTSIALAFAVLEATGSITAVGLVLAATRLPLVIFVLVGGVVGDRLPRQRVMLASDLVRLATQAVAAALLLTHRTALWHLLVLFALHGAAQAFFNPAASGLVPQTVSPARLQQANALLDLSRNATGILGTLAGGALVALVGGALVALVGAGAAFAVDSLTFAASAASLALLRPGGIVRTKPPGAFLRELAAGWEEFRSRTWLWVGVLHIALLNAFALVSFFALGPVVALRSLGGAASWATIAAAFAAGMIAGNSVALRWRPRRPLVAAFAVVAAAAPQLALLGARAPVVAIAGAAVLGGAQASFFGAIWATTLQQRIPAESIARVSAYGSLGSLVLVPIGFALVGPLAEWLGINTLLWLGAAWIVAATAVVLSVPSIRQLRATGLAVPEPA